MRTYHVSDGVQTADPLDISLANTSGPKNGGRVNCHSSDTDPFLHNLEPDDKLDAATSVELAGTSAGKHGPVRGAGCSLSLEFGNVADILEFRLGLAHIFTSLASQTAKDIATFLLTANFDQPTRRFREEPNDCEKEEKWNDLESDREAPNERAIALGVEGASIFEPVSDDDTEDIQSEFNGDKFSSGFVFGCLSGPHGYDGVQDSGAPAIDKTGKDHPGVIHG